jgi:hypothetical protein
MADRYLVGTGNRNTNTTASWSDTSGGSSGASVPGAGDNAIMDANSGLTGVTITVNAAMSVATFSYTGGAAKTNVLSLAANLATSGNLALNGNSRLNQLLVCSNVIGTPCTITCNGTVTVTNCDFKDMVGAGTASWDFSAQTDIGGGTALTGCSGITFPAPVPQYWYKASGAANNWSTVGNWYLGTGGSGGAGRIPLIQDKAIMDDLSFGATGMTLTQDMPRVPDFTFLGVDGVHPVANVPTLTPSTVCSVYGGMALHTATTGMVLTASTPTYTFEGRGSYGLTSAGNTFGKQLNLNAPLGSITIQDALIAFAVYVNNGTFDFNDQTVTATYQIVIAATGSLILGTGLVTIPLTAADSAWNCHVSASLDATGSTIKLTGSSANTKKFEGGGKVYNNLHFSPGSGTGKFNITGSNSFVQLKDDGTEAHSIKFTKSTTTTIATWNVSGSAGKLKTLDTVDGAGTFTLHLTGAGPVVADYLSISRSTVDASPEWYAGSHSVDVTGNTNWIFADPVSFKPYFVRKQSQVIGGGLR